MSLSQRGLGTIEVKVAHVHVCVVRGC